MRTTKNQLKKVLKRVRKAQANIINGNCDAYYLQVCALKGQLTIWAKRYDDGTCDLLDFVFIHDDDTKVEVENKLSTISNIIQYTI